MSPLLIAGGLVGVIALVIRFASKRRYIEPEAYDEEAYESEEAEAAVYDPEAVADVEEESWMPSWIPTFDPADKIIDYTAREEGRGKYDAVNANTDLAGLSFGLIQYAQRVGGLGRLVQAMFERDPALFNEIFGTSGDLILGTTNGPDDATRMTLRLWEEPYVSMFRRSGREETFQQVQRDLAREDYYNPALAIAQQHDVHSERGLSLLFDTAVQQGTGALAKIASRTTARRPADESEWLRLFVEEAVKYAPAKWKDMIARRRGRILRSTKLSDDPVV